MSKSQLRIALKSFLGLSPRHEYIATATSDEEAGLPSSSTRSPRSQRNRRRSSYLILAGLLSMLMVFYFGVLPDKHVSAYFDAILPDTTISTHVGATPALEPVEDIPAQTDDAPAFVPVKDLPAKVDDAPAFVPEKYDTWTWKLADGSVCADGSPTGFGYSIHPNATDLVIYMMPGGGCWDTQTCFTDPKASNLGGYNASSFKKSKGGVQKAPWFQRGKGFFKEANYFFIPYCTADFHAGDNIVTYDGAPAPIHHKGFNNVQNVFKFAQQVTPNPKNVWINGASAGCYGAMLNYVPAQKAFPSAQVHYIGDACGATPGLLNTFPTWKMYQPQAPDCPECQPGEFNTFLPALARQNPKSRFALLSFQVDGVLPFYVRSTVEAFKKDLADYRAVIDKIPGHQAKNFVLPGRGHIVHWLPKLRSAGGVALSDWINVVGNLSSGDAFRSV